MSTTPLSPPVEFAMRQALQEAQHAAQAGEVPVGAVVMRTDSGQIVARAQNRMRRDGDATAHAEVLALREAARMAGDARLGEYTLVVTLEPCAMCAGAIVLSRIGVLVFGAWDEKAGMCGSIGDIVRHARLNHRPAVQGGVLEPENKALLQQFFSERR
jgi:tRNA(adenine34) deaminase